MSEIKLLYFVFQCFISVNLMAEKLVCSQNPVFYYYFLTHYHSPDLPITDKHNCPDPCMTFSLLDL